MTFPHRSIRYELVSCSHRVLIRVRAVQPGVGATRPVSWISPRRSGAVANPSEVSDLPHVPMPRYVGEPFCPRGLEADVGVEAAGHGAMDDGLLLLLQQFNQ